MKVAPVARLGSSSPAPAPVSDKVFYLKKSNAVVHEPFSDRCKKRVHKCFDEDYNLRRRYKKHKFWQVILYIRLLKAVNDATEDSEHLHSLFNFMKRGNAPKTGRISPMAKYKSLKLKVHPSVKEFRKECYRQRYKHCQQQKLMLNSVSTNGIAQTSITDIESTEAMENDDDDEEDDDDDDSVDVDGNFDATTPATNEFESTQPMESDAVDVATGNIDATTPVTDEFGSTQPMESNDLDVATGNIDATTPVTDEFESTQPMESNAVDVATTEIELTQPTESDDVDAMTSKMELTQPMESDDVDAATKEIELTHPMESKEVDVASLPFNPHTELLLDSNGVDFTGTIVQSDSPWVRYAGTINPFDCQTATLDSPWIRYAGTINPSHCKTATVVSDNKELEIETSIMLTNSTPLYNLASSSATSTTTPPPAISAATPASISAINTAPAALMTTEATTKGIEINEIETTERMESGDVDVNATAVVTTKTNEIESMEQMEGGNVAGDNDDDETTASTADSTCMMADAARVNSDDAGNQCHALYGKGFCHKWRDVQGLVRTTYGNVKECITVTDPEIRTALGNLKKEKMYRVNYITDKMWQSLSGSSGRDYNEMMELCQTLETSLVSEKVAWGGYMTSVQDKIETSPLTKVPFHVKWLIPSTRRAYDNGRKLIMEVKGFQLMFTVEPSTIEGAGLGLMLSVTDNTLEGRTVFVLQPGERLGLGRYAPLHSTDCKSRFAFTVKNFIHDCKPSVYAFEANHNYIDGTYGKAFIFDVTDDKTGKLHELAEQNPLMRVNEISQKERPNVVAEYDPTGGVQYCLGTDNRNKLEVPVGSKTELKIDYSESYEWNRIMQNYPRIKGKQLEAMEKTVHNRDHDTLDELEEADLIQLEECLTFIENLFDPVWETTYQKLLRCLVITFTLLRLCVQVRRKQQIAHATGPDATSAVIRAKKLVATLCHHLCTTGSSGCDTSSAGIVCGAGTLIATAMVGDHSIAIATTLKAAVVSWPLLQQEFIHCLACCDSSFASLANATAAASDNNDNDGSSNNDNSTPVNWETYCFSSLLRKLYNL